MTEVPPPQKPVNWERVAGILVAGTFLCILAWRNPQEIFFWFGLLLMFVLLNL